MKRRILHFLVYCFCLLGFLVFFSIALAAESYGEAPTRDEKCLKARAFYQEGTSFLNYQDRRNAFQKAVEFCPDYAEAHNNLADALENLGLEKKAIFTKQSQDEGDQLLDLAEKHYKRAIQIKPDLLASRLGLAVVSIAQGRIPIAIKNYEKALKISPGYPFLRERVELLKKIDSSGDEKLRTSRRIVADIKSQQSAQNLNTMGFEDSVIRDIQNRPRQSFNNILFQPWSSVIDAGDPILQLNEIGKALTSEEMRSFKFVIEGHANNVGEYDRNMRLSNDRANAVRDYLMNKFGVDSSRIIIQGFGFSKPKHLPDTDVRNRRVEIVFVNEASGR